MRLRLVSFPFMPVAMLLAILAIAAACQGAPDRTSAAAAVGSIVFLAVAFRLFLKMAEDDWRREYRRRMADRIIRQVKMED